MTTTEIILNMLAETATKDLSAQEKPAGMDANVAFAKRGGRIAGNARRELEAELGRTVISPQNAAQLNTVVTGMIEDISQISDEKEDK